jgi:hypothetical protein
MDIFISYRRQDTAGYALGLRREIARALPDAKVFLDVESLDAGMKWREVICDRVGQCDLMLVIIGDEWLRTRAGDKKIERPDDPVRFELETALARPQMQLIPVLVEDTPMPPVRELPESVREMCAYSAHAIHDRTYDQDVNALLELLARKQMAPPVVPPPTAGGGAALTPPDVAAATFPSKITERYVYEVVPGMGRDQLLAFVAELVRRAWDPEDIYEYGLSCSSLQPAKRLPARITLSWLATNVPLLSPTRVEKLIRELRKRNWGRDDIRTHVLGNRQAGLAPPIPTRIQESWVSRYAPLMTTTEQDELAAVLLTKGWTLEEVLSYMPYADVEAS